jgi:hypothetical protein
MKKKVEVFTAGCSVCTPIVDLIKSNASDSCEVIIYDLIKQCNDKVCLSKAIEYGIKSIPAIAVDGKLLSCCQNNGISREELVKAGVLKN